MVLRTASGKKERAPALKKETAAEEHVRIGEVHSMGEGSWVALQKYGDIFVRKKARRGRRRSSRGHRSPTYIKQKFGEGSSPAPRGHMTI